MSNSDPVYTLLLDYNAEDQRRKFDRIIRQSEMYILTYSFIVFLALIGCFALICDVILQCVWGGIDATSGIVFFCVFIATFSTLLLFITETCREYYRLKRLLIRYPTGSRAAAVSTPSYYMSVATGTIEL